VGARVITVIGAVLGQPATPARPTILLEAALHATTTLLRSVSFVGWPGLRLRVRIAPAPILRPPVRPGQDVAVADMSAGDQHQTVPVVVTHELASPSLWWRLTYP
jgi:hypothetical protein